MFKKSALMALVLVCASPFAAQADKYDDCMKEAGEVGDSAMAVCMTDRTKELMDKLKEAYENAVKNEAFTAWNGSDNMKTGVFRSIFDAWISYRDKFCSAHTVSMRDYLGSDEYNNAECLMKHTEAHLIEMGNMLINSQSTPE